MTDDDMVDIESYADYMMCSQLSRYYVHIVRLVSDVDVTLGILTFEEIPFGG
jgi:hypothetical protein